MTWVFLVLAYGLIKGLREVFKKKALEKNTALEVLFLYTLISFAFVIPSGWKAWEEDASTLIVVAFKSLAIFLAWIFSFNSIQHIPISLYGILDLSRILFATFLGVVVMDERLGYGQIIGLSLVAIGLLMLKLNPFDRSKKDKKNNSHDSSVNKKEFEKKNDSGVNAITSEGISETGNTSETGNCYSDVVTKSNMKFWNTVTFHVVLTIVSCLLNSVSGVMDKWIMARTTMTEGHLQFWYMLFLVVYYGIYVLAVVFKNRKTATGKMTDDSKCDNQISSIKFNFRGALKNYWIWILAVFFVIADRCLFIANADPASRVTVMTLIKQSCCLVTILAGKFIFHEKNILHKLICTAVIISGIVLSVVL